MSRGGFTEPDTRKFDPVRLAEFHVRVPAVKELQEKGKLLVHGKEVLLEEVSKIRPGDSIAVVIDTRYCQNAIDIAKGAKILLCESTYTSEHQDLATKHFHLTAAQAASIAKQAGVKKLILTHFSARYLNLREMEAEAKAIFPNTFMAEDLRTFPFEK